MQALLTEVEETNPERSKCENDSDTLHQAVHACRTLMTSDNWTADPALWPRALGQQDASELLLRLLGNMAGAHSMHEHSTVTCSRYNSVSRQAPGDHAALPSGQLSLNSGDDGSGIGKPSSTSTSAVTAAPVVSHTRSWAWLYGGAVVSIEKPATVALTQFRTSTPARCAWVEPERSAVCSGSLALHAQVDRIADDEGLTTECEIACGQLDRGSPLGHGHINQAVCRCRYRLRTAPMAAAEATAACRPPGQLPTRTFSVPSPPSCIGGGTTVQRGRPTSYIHDIVRARRRAAARAWHATMRVPRRAMCGGVPARARASYSSRRVRTLRSRVF